MITVNKSVEIKKVGLKSIVEVTAVVFIGIGLMLLGMILVDTSVITGVALILSGIAGMIVRVAILSYIRRKALLKYLKSFLDELSACGFNCDVVFDSGALCEGDPAVIVVDRLRREVGLMFYNNPKSPYLIPAGLIKQVWSGKDFFESTVSASFGFCVNRTVVTVPTKVRHSSRFRYAIDYRTRQRYVNGKCRKAFNEAVEKADEFAKVLKKLTVLW